MSDVSEAAKAKAYALAYEGQARFDDHNSFMVSRVARAFATFIQQVSDAAKEASALFSAHQASATCFTARNTLAPFILPEPVDPLVEVMETWARTPGSATHCPAAERAKVLREALAKRGLKIVEASDA